MPPQKHILPVIVLSQFFCTSLWFASNGVMADLVLAFSLKNSAIGHLTSAVQFGFITGTLIFAIFTIPDRYAPSRVFFFCALAGALFNLAAILGSNTFTSLFILRFLTGVSLAGIYPVGMKIAADHFKEGLGRSLGYLVGALVLGTSLPHLLKGLSADLPWAVVIVSTSAIATSGGVLMLVFVPEGPYRGRGGKVDLSSFIKVFRKRDLRSSAIGYFGHMWELYAFWAFVPVMLKIYSSIHPGTVFNVPMLSFVVIATGAVGCVVGGYLSQRFGEKKIALVALLFSGACCLSSPLLFTTDWQLTYVAILIVWGFFVIPDSPMFSSLVAGYADANVKGTALTIVNSIGFAITIGSIQLINSLVDLMNPSYVFILLGAGPIIGFVALIRNKSLR